MKEPFRADMEIIRRRARERMDEGAVTAAYKADRGQVIEVLKESGGWGEMVTDEEILDGIHLLAETEGIFTEPAGGTTIAVTRKLIDQERIPRDESIVMCITDPDVPIYLYPADHGFHCDERGSFDKDSAKLAWERTLEFFAKHVG